MTSLRVMVRMWHGGYFVNDRAYVGKAFLDIPEYDIFEWEDAFVNELLAADFGYDTIGRYAFRDKDNGNFLFVDPDDESTDIVTLAMRFMDDERKILEIYCECKKEETEERIERDKGKEKVVEEGGPIVQENEGREPTVEENKEGEGIEDSDFDFDDKVFEDDGESDDGLEDTDFSDEDDEFLEARRNGRANQSKTSVENPKDKGKSVVQEDVVGSLEDNLEEKAVFDEEDIDSDASCASLDSEGNKKTKSKLYSKDIPFKDLKLELGMRFKDPKECQDVVRQWAVANGYNIKWTKSAHGKVQAICTNGCHWRLYASKIHGEPTCIIKTLSGEHTCLRAHANRQVSSKFVAAHFIEKIKSNANITVKEMVKEMRLTYGVNVRPVKCYRGKKMALDSIRGTFDDHYAKLRPYVLELMRTDKEGRFELKTHLDKRGRPVFERLYIGFSALWKGFLIGCRKFIGFDACFLKTVLGGALLAAVSKDCNSQMYPIAWAVVEKENEQSWSWFFERLFEDLNIRDGLGWTFMSDKQKGLINGIRNLAPNSEHRHCARHIYANWKKHFAGPKYKALFWNVVKATCKADYEWAMNEMRKTSTESATDFEARGPNAFCKALVNSFTKTDIVDNNVSETFNSYILKSRDKVIIDMLEDIRTMIMTRIYNLSTSMEKCVDSSDPLCPNVRKKLTRLQDLMRICDVRPAVGGKFEVHMNDDTHVVCLVENNCTCREWELTGIPCCHALSCIFHNRDDHVAYVDRFYYKSNAVECYKLGLSPLRGHKSWPTVDEAPILPPTYSRSAGRPKKRRIRGLDDQQNISKTKWSMRGLRMSCKNCGEFDHNKRTCKQPPRVSQEPSSTTQPKVPRARQPRAPPTSMMNPPKPNNLVNFVLQREMRTARQGYGALVSTETGNIYVRDPGTRGAHFVSGSQGAARPSKRKKDTVASTPGSQGSQVENPTPP